MADNDKNTNKNVLSGIAHAVGGAVGTIGDAVGGAVGTVGGTVGGAVSAVTSAIGGNSSDDVADAPAIQPEAQVPQHIQTKADAASKLPEYLRTRRAEVGRVVSNKMQKTVVVIVQRSKPHPLYKKVMRRSVKFMAHDDIGAGMGDIVRIIESRPMSKRKRWQVVEILQRGEQL